MQGDGKGGGGRGSRSSEKLYSSSGETESYSGLFVASLLNPGPTEGKVAVRDTEGGKERESASDETVTVVVVLLDVTGVIVLVKGAVKVPDKLEGRGVVASG